MVTQRVPALEEIVTASTVFVSRKDSSPLLLESEFLLCRFFFLGSRRIGLLNYIHKDMNSEC